MTLSKSAKNIVVELLTIAALVLPLAVFGQVTGGPDTGAELVGLIKTIANWFAAIFFIVAVIFIILAAFSYLGAGGDEEKIKSAKQKLVYAVVAIIVAALAFFVPKIVLDILNIEVKETPPTGVGNIQ